ncbi:MAG: hypothetical protein II922_09285 [Succinimonas sp.]|nr:hypothetical protein [Succinimonas sp.]
MSEDLYENENDTDTADEIADDGQFDNDLEVELSRRAPKGDVFQQIFPRTRHWLREGVRPEEILREDKDDLVFSFVKRMKDPDYPQTEGVRYIKFRSTLAISELEVEMTFTHIELFYQDADGNLGPAIPVKDGAEECRDIQKVFDKVIDNLAGYLSKVNNR